MSAETVESPRGVIGADLADSNSRRIGDSISTGDNSSPNIVPSFNVEAQNAAANEGNQSERRRRSTSSALLELMDAGDLWHDSNRVGYATIPIDDHVEHWPVRSRDFRRWLSSQYYRRTRAAIGGNALDDATRVLEARAINDGPLFETFVRVGREGDCILVDQGDAQWSAIKISSDGWHMVSAPSIKFVRTPGMRPLPEPEAGESIDILRRFVHVRSNDDFISIVAWLVAAFRNCGPYPILIVNGEQGTGKSFFCRIIRSLIDPNAAPIRAVPKDERDLVVSASNCHVLALDNLSWLPAWLSDALCRVSTGGGFATRMLHTDRDETIIELQRPILLNGIPALTDRADLADRAITIHLAPIPEESRKPEDELKAEFASQWPFILGALCDAVSAALRNLPSVRIERSPRMADFVKWFSAAAPGLGWDAELFMRAYRGNRQDMSESAFESDPVAVAIRDHSAAVHPREPWTGTPTEWLAALNAHVTDGMKRSRLWPQTAQALGGRVDRAAPLLRAQGFRIERYHSGVRTIMIVPPVIVASDVVP